MDGTEGSHGRIGILRPLRIRDFGLLWAGLTVSLTGDGIFLVALAWQVYRLENRPSALATVGVAWTLPMILLSLVGGVLSDRTDRRRILLAADGLRGLAVAGMAILTITGAVHLWHFIVLAVVYGCGEALFGPAFSAIVPDLVPQEQLVQANSVAQFVRPFASVLVGPAIGGFLVGGIGAGWALAADAGTFAFSASMIVAMHRLPRARPGGAEATLVGDLLEGFRYVRAHTWLWAAMGAATVSLLCFWGPFEVLVPYVVKNVLHGDGTELGFVFAAGGAGAVLAALVVGQRPLPRRTITVMYLSWALGTVTLVGFGIASHLWQMCLASVVSQVGFTVLLVFWYTLLQRLVPSALLGRVASVDWLISGALIPVSLALVGPVAAALGAQRTLIVAGVAGALTIMVFLLLIPGARGPERDGSITGGGPREPVPTAAS